MKLYHLWQTIFDESSLFLPFAEHQIFCNICRLNFPFVAQKMCAQAKLQSQPNFQISCIQTILVTYILTLWSIQRPMIWNFNLIPKIRPFWNRGQMHCPIWRKFFRKKAFWQCVLWYGRQLWRNNGIAKTTSLSESPAWLYGGQKSKPCWKRQTFVTKFNIF